MARPEDAAPDSVADKSDGTEGVPVGLVQQWAALNLPPQDDPADPKPGDVWVGKPNNPGLFIHFPDGTYRAALEKVKK